MRLLVVTLIVVILSCILVKAQYGYQGGNHAPGGYGDTGGGHGGEQYGEMDDRPKVNLGIRLRIPAFKFELPRFNLPKITVSAKIRQPEGPRVIQLPEINLDTSSKSELPGNKGGGGGYGDNYHGPAYGMGASSSYGGGHDKTGMISFSTEEEHPARYQQQPMAYKTSYQTQSAGYGQPQRSRHLYQQQPQRQQPSYSPTNVQPIYWAHGGGAVAAPPSQIVSQDHQLTQHETPDKNPDFGFNQPAYVSPAGTK